LGARRGPPPAGAGAPSGAAPETGTDDRGRCRRGCVPATHGPTDGGSAAARRARRRDAGRRGGRATIRRPGVRRGNGTGTRVVLGTCHTDQESGSNETERNMTTLKTYTPRASEIERR